MKNFIIYTESGKILRVGTCQNEVFDLQAMPGELITEGTANPSSQYIENNIIVDMPPKPNGDYVFDYIAKQWVFDEQLAITKALYKRDTLLAEGPDRISPIWYNAMTDEQKTAWANYRQALLDITQQPDYPNVIIWPIKPTEGA